MSWIRHDFCLYFVSLSGDKLAYELFWKTVLLLLNLAYLLCLELDMILLIFCLPKSRQFCFCFVSKLETNLLISLHHFSYPEMGWEFAWKFFQIREYSTVGSAYLMTDSTDRLASTVINLVLPDKVFVMACQRGWVLYSVSRCVEVKRIDSGLAFPSLRGWHIKGDWHSFLAEPVETHLCGTSVTKKKKIQDPNWTCRTKNRTQTGPSIWAFL